VEWSAVAKTPDGPIDLEIDARALTMWTKPAGKTIDALRREQLFDEIASYYSKGPLADVVNLMVSRCYEGHLKVIATALRGTNVSE
jgi:hypothetical protein